MILPTGYLAPIAYYKALLQATDMAEIEQWESFHKQTYRNRCCIAGTNGVQTLSIPVGKCESKQYTRDVRITYQTKWQHQHWMALVSAYKHTPYFLYYEDLFRPFYEQQYAYLIDYNEALNDLVLRLLGKPNKVERTADWQGKDLESCWQYPKGITGKKYYQLFADKQGFTDNLSIVDLLFNMGNEAILYL